MPLAPVARAHPAHPRLRDGYQTLIAMQNVPNVAFWEREVSPPGMDGGDKVDTSTMFNIHYRQYKPRTLITATPASGQAGYAPQIYEELINQINVEQAISVHFPDGSIITFYGFLKEFKPNGLKEGEFPIANYTFEPTNTDPATGEEVDPLFTPGSGT